LENSEKTSKQGVRVLIKLSPKGPMKFEKNKAISIGLLKINDKTTADDVLEIIAKELSKDVSKYNDALKENWVTAVKNLREATTLDSWTKWNSPMKLTNELRLNSHSEKGFLVVQSLRDSVYYVVDLSDVPKCGSFNPYGNEQMEPSGKREISNEDIQVEVNLNKLEQHIQELTNYLESKQVDFVELKDYDDQDLKELLQNAGFNEVTLRNKMLKYINEKLKDKDQPSSTTKVFYDLSLPWYFRVMDHCRSSLTV